LAVARAQLRILVASVPGKNAMRACQLPLSMVLGALLGTVLFAVFFPPQARAQTVSLNSEGHRISIQVGDAVALPADFPADVPLPPDARLTKVERGGNGLLLAFQVAGGADATASRFATGMAGAGWTSAVAATVQDRSTLAWEKDDRAVLAEFAPDGATSTRLRLQLLPRR
jgi:hypothetical protein